MATKISKEHARFLIEDQEHHKLIDIFINLAKLSSEVKTDGFKKFIIHAPSSSKYQLSKALLSIIPSVKSRQTIYTTLNHLIDNGILSYNQKLYGWEIVGMEKMVTDEGSGYLELRELFFTPLFDNLTYLEKKTLFYMTYIMSLKNYKKVKRIRVNVLSKDSELRKIYKTTNVYYIKKQVKSVVEKFFTPDNTSVPELKNLNPSSRKRALRRFYFKFDAVPSKLIESTLAKPRMTPKERVDSYREKDSGFYGYLHKLPGYMTWAGKYLTYELKDQLLRQCAALRLSDKQAITLQILKQLEKGTVISSLSKYIGKTIQTYLEERTSFA